MAKVLIIGFGNTLRRDDGLGPIAAEQLGAELSAGGVEAEVLTQHQLMPEMAEPISAAQVVVFIDAASDHPAGQINIEPVGGPTGNSMDFSHHLDAATLVGLARELYGQAPRHAIIASIGGIDFGYGEGFSPEVGNALGELVGQIAQYVKRNA